jgi:hypothetical protein
MGRLVEFDTGDGDSVLVEVTDTSSAGSAGPVTRGLGVDKVAEHAHRSFEDAVGRVQPAAQAIISRLRDLADTPDEVQVEFGLGINAEAGGFIASASTTANFKVTITWRRPPPLGE